MESIENNETTHQNEEVQEGRKLVDPTIDLISENNSPNRKVVFASLASAIGTLVSIFLSTTIVDILPELSKEDQGTLRTSIAAVITSLVTLSAGYYTAPAIGDGVKPKE